MPKVDIKRDLLFARLGKTYTQEEFENLCFEFGIELDDVFTEKSQIKKEQGKELKEASDEVIYKLDIPANRYDLLCVEGVVRGFLTFLDPIKNKCPRFTVSNPMKKEVLIIKPDTARVRKFAVAAVLRNVTFTQDAYDSFIDLQDKLHQNICRRRTLVSIGTHDLDTIKGPFVYDAKAPKDIKFLPLRSPERREYVADELLTAYESDQQLKAYVPIIKGKDVYPVMLDSNNVVMSLPPIINGDHSKITLKTKNVFIELTATDLTKAKVVLNTIVCMFSEYCALPFVVEPVEVRSPDGTSTSYPDLSYRVEKVKAAMITRRMGIPAEKTPAELAGYLTRMQLTSTVDKDGQTINVEVPPTRSDILHECDIWEDAAVAYGFNTIKWTIPKVATIGKQLPINKLTDQMRHVVAQAGYSEALTFALCKHDDNFKSLRRPDDGRSAVVIANPKTAEFQVARCNLIAGLFKTLSSNSHMALPIKVFEISDVVLKSSTSDTGAQNHRRLALANYNKTSDFDSIQGVVDRIMNMLGVQHRCAPQQEGKTYKTYSLVPSQDPAFFGALGAADIIYEGKRVGVMGVVHPEVLANYSLKCACSAAEIDLEAFL